MRKLFLALIFAALPCVSRAGVRSPGPNPGVFVNAVASTSTADITYYWAMDSATSGQSPQKGFGTITIGASWVSTTPAIVGTASIYNSNSGNSAGKITISTNSFTLSGGRIGFYAVLKEATGAGTIGMPFWGETSTGTATSKMELQVNSSGVWLLDYSNATQLNLGTLLTQDTTAFIEIAFDYTGATLGAPCKVFKDGVSQGTCSGTPNAGAPTSIALHLGGQDANATALKMDQFLYSTNPTRDLNALKNTTSF